MPVIKSAKKQLRQSLKRRAHNKPLQNELKTVVKKGLKFIKEGKIEEVTKFLPVAYKKIDMAAKKNLIHKKNASRKKSLLARGLNSLQKGKKA